MARQCICESDGAHQRNRVVPVDAEAAQGRLPQVHAKHLHRYVNEFSGRHNIRELVTIEQMEIVVAGMVGRRIMYKDVVSGENGRLNHVSDKISNYGATKVTDTNDPLVKRNLEMKILEEARKEGREIIYDISTMNSETARVCRENLKKRPAPVPEDYDTYLDKRLRIND